MKVVKKDFQRKYTHILLSAFLPYCFKYLCLFPHQDHHNSMLSEKCMQEKLPVVNANTKKIA